MESLCKGLSGMDAARAAMGQGWPFAAGPRSNDVAREPRRSRGRMSGLDLLVPFGGAGHPGNAKRNPLVRAELDT